LTVGYICVIIILSVKTNIKGVGSIITIDKAGAEALASLLLDEVHLYGYAARYPEAHNLYKEARKRIFDISTVPIKKQRRAKNEITKRTSKNALAI